MKKLLILMLLMSFTICSCGLTKKDLGLAKQAPDATKVETRKSLDLPPDFYSLPN